MESSETHNNFDSWSSATNWIVAGGSIRNSVTFESSLSLINDDQNDNHDLSSTMNSTAKSPLILYSPPNSTPCEITITFPQKHEVQQIYIRSTARIYEIYCASELGRSNEYLCTVRCGVATRAEQVLHATDIEKVVCAHQKGSTKELNEERERHSGNVNTNEDDWVEVKLLGTSLVDNGNSSLSSNTKTNEGRMSQKQDLFEATAEITDANPCTSITLRLLSLQNKSCVCIDEVYVFADPVDTADLDNKTGPTENAAGSSLMAMLMPSFLELSKTKRSGHTQDKLDINRMTRQKSVAIEEKPSDPIDAENKILDGGKTGSAFNEGVQLQEAVTPISKPVELEIPPQVPDTESKHDMPHSHIEGVLNQLVSRVNRIEDLFLRFESSMLNPIRSIDERLQRVEQHLEVMTKKTQNSGLLSCTRISAPEFSCSESETNSLYNSGCVDIGDATSEANKKDSVPAVPSIPSSVSPVSVNTTNTHPSHVITTPGFSNGDDGEEYDAMEPLEEFPKEKQENALSIDDALASALARFISSTSVQSPQYSKVLAVKAPEFPNEEGDNNEKTASTEGHCKMSTEPPTCSSEFEQTECVISSFASLSISSSVITDQTETRSHNDNNCVEKDEGVDEQLRNSESGLITDNVEFGEVSNGTSETTELDQFVEDQINDNSDNTEDFAASNEFVPNTEVTILQSVAEFRNAALKVDFEIPILEVKFTSEESMDAKSPLEALLAGIPDLKDEDNSPKEQNKDSSQSEDHQYNLIPVEDFGATVSATDNGISIDADYYSLTALPLSAEGIMHLI